MEGIVSIRFLFAPLVTRAWDSKTFCYLATLRSFVGMGQTDGCAAECGSPCNEDP